MTRTVGIFLIALLGLSVTFESAVNAASLAEIEQSKLKVSRSVVDNQAKIDEIFGVISSRVDKLEDNSCKLNLVKLVAYTKKMIERENEYCGTKFIRNAATINSSFEDFSGKLESLESDTFGCMKTALVNTKEYFELLKSQTDVCKEWNGRNNE